LRFLENLILVPIIGLRPQTSRVLSFPLGLLKGFCFHVFLKSPSQFLIPLPCKLSPIALHFATCLPSPCVLQLLYMALQAFCIAFCSTTYFHHLAFYNPSRLFCNLFASPCTLHHFSPSPYSAIFLHCLVLYNFFPRHCSFFASPCASNTFTTFLHNIIHSFFITLFIVHSYPLHYIKPPQIFLRFSFCYANFHFVVHLFFMICSLIHHLIHHPSHNKGPSCLTIKICVLALLFLLFIYTKSFLYALVLLFIKGWCYFLLFFVKFSWDGGYASQSKIASS
jgi:hypothetical protein